MKTVLLRCRDAEMFGPVCDYVTEEAPLDEAFREMRVHAKTHNEPDITDEETSWLGRILRTGESALNF